MIDIPITDTHVHFWDPGRLRYRWLADSPKLNKPHLLPDYLRATEGLKIERVVFVQCEVDFSQYREEAAWVTRQAEIDSRIKGIVSWAPMEKGDAARDELAELAANPLVKGVRRLLQSEKDAGFCLQADFVRAVRRLPEFDLSFDICIKGDDQLRSVIELVRRCPDTAFILDHIAKPFIKEKIIEPWASLLKDLAALPNSSCKMSGLVNEADRDTWTLEDLRPYIRHVIDCFGLDRVMYGGDWPVCTLATTYRRWVETLWEALRDCSQEESLKLFHTNAERVYGL